MPFVACDLDNLNRTSNFLVLVLVCVLARLSIVPLLLVGCLGAKLLRIPNWSKVVRSITLLTTTYSTRDYSNYKIFDVLSSNNPCRLKLSKNSQNWKIMENTPCLTRFSGRMNNIPINIQLGISLYMYCTSIMERW